MESMPKVSELKWRDTEAETEAATTAAQERCTTPPAPSAERHVKFPSSPMAPGPCTAAIATRSTSQPAHPGRPEDTNSISIPFWDIYGSGVGFQTLQDKFFIIGLFCEVIYFLPYSILLPPLSIADGTE